MITTFDKEVTDILRLLQIDEISKAEVLMLATILVRVFELGMEFERKKGEVRDEFH